MYRDGRLGGWGIKKMVKLELISELETKSLNKIDKIDNHYDNLLLQVIGMGHYSPIPTHTLWLKRLTSLLIFTRTSSHFYNYFVSYFSVVFNLKTLLCACLSNG